MRSLSWILIGVVLHGVLQLGPAWRTVTTTPSARDYASYHYAVHAAAQGSDPYDNAALARLAQAERTRKSVHPYFYPPPFLLTMGWALPLSLRDGYLVMLGLNELLLASCLTILVVSFGVAPPVITLLLATYTPIPDNAWMGQANLMALLPALGGLVLARRRPVLGGILVGTAGMLKMSPALFLLYWALERRWKAVLAAVATAIGLSLLTLPLVGLPVQLSFYRDILPGFAAGDYHGLTVPISLSANHSIPDLFNRWWPGTSETRLSDTAQSVSKLVTLGLLAAWAWWFRPPGPANTGSPPKPTFEARAGAALGVLTVLMVVLPAYTYEHHLVFLLLPVSLAGTLVWQQRRLAPMLVFAVVYFFLAWPLDWLRAAGKAMPQLEDPIRESKFLAEIGLMLLLAWLGRAAATRSPAESATPAPA